MAQKSFLPKKLQLDKANSTITIVVSVAAFVIVFCLVASKSLLSQSDYQGRVIAAQSTAVNQLKSDLTAANNLDSAYTAFANTPTNVLGGDPTGSSSNSGNNAKIVLDALPAQYDFPALVTSLESLISQQGLDVEGITGTDQSLSLSTATSSSPVAMPFEIDVKGTEGQVEALVSALQASIRPFQFITLDFTSGSDDLVMSLNAQSYYQPEVNFNIGSETVQ